MDIPIVRSKIGKSFQKRFFDVVAEVLDGVLGSAAALPRLVARISAGQVFVCWSQQLPSGVAGILESQCNVDVLKLL